MDFHHHSMPDSKLDAAGQALNLRRVRSTVSVATFDGSVTSEEPLGAVAGTRQQDYAFNIVFAKDLITLEALGNARELLIDMPLYLEPNGYVLVPLENTYNRAFEALPKRWRSVVEA